MPHLVIERIRSFAFGSKLEQPESELTRTRRLKDNQFNAFVIEVLDIIAAVVFVFGSACFLPQYSVNVQTFLLGCDIFIWGSILYCVICLLTFSEAFAIQGAWSFEVWENGLYLLGSALFLVGSVMYRPVDMEVDEDSFLAISTSRMAAMCRAFSTDYQFTGAILFIVGSLLFTCAAFTNALNQRYHDEWTSKMLTAVTSCYMAGSQLFAMGSIAFLPHLGCGESMVALGAWCFIVGSLILLVGSIVSFVRTSWIFQLGEDERHELDLLAGKSFGFHAQPDQPFGLHAQPDQPFSVHTKRQKSVTFCEQA